MDNIRGLLVFGASGAGTTTLGCELARLLGFEHHDIDDYVWEPTNPPFIRERPLGERVRLLRSSIKGRFVLSGCLREWGGAFDKLLDMAVFVNTPTALRLERLEEREFGRYGKRIKPGGDLNERHQKFIEYVATYDNGGMGTRSLASQMAWAETLACPVVVAPNAGDYRKNAKSLVEQYEMIYHNR